MHFIGKDFTKNLFSLSQKKDFLEIILSNFANILKINHDCKGYFIIFTKDGSLLKIKKIGELCREKSLNFTKNLKKKLFSYASRMKSFHTESEAVLLIELDLKKSAILFLNSFKKDQLKRIQHLLEDFAYEYNWLEYYNYLKEKNEDMDLMWKDRNLKKIFPKLKKIALSDEPVLLIGETGTGKEIISQFIHFLSKRKEKPFSPINCASFSSDELICSELFGHKKGAFTGAISNAQGKIKSAEGGTLFLDEIQSSSFKFQNALLRFIERKEIQPVGSEKIERVNARVVSACSSCPKKLMDKRKLLPELYYRLSHFQIKLTPLREKKDIENYIFYFLFKICGKMGIKEKEITEEAMNYLKKYVWPGNLRELKATISSAVIHSKDDYIKIEDLPQEVIKQNRKISQSSELLNRKTLPEKLIEFEREEILRALRENDWNITKASKILGISRQNLQQRMKKLKIGY